MKKRIISLLLAVVMIIGMLPLGVITAFAEVTDTAVPFLNWSETEKKLYEDSVTDYTPITSDSLTVDSSKLYSGWYVVKDEVTFTGFRIIAEGDVHLILCDGAKLTASKGISVPSGNSLTVYGQENGTGTLNANADIYYAGIGGDNGVVNGHVTNNGNSGSITVNGGKIRAQGGFASAGIGGGLYGVCGSVTVNGGDVTAVGGFKCAGITNGSGAAAGTNLAISDNMLIFAGNAENTMTLISLDDYKNNINIVEEGGNDQKYVRICDCKHEGKAPNCTESGYETYYEYDGNYYEDSALSREITDIDAWLAPGGDGYKAPDGHDWKCGTGEDYLYHICEKCSAKEKHTFANGECTVCGGWGIGDSDGNVMIPKVSVSSSRVIYTADETNHRKPGNTLVKATPSGIAELSTYDEPRNRTSRDLYYAGEEPVNPTIVLTSDRELDADGFKVTPLNGNNISVTSVFIDRAESAYTYTWYIICDKDISVDDGQKHLDFRIDYSYTYESVLTGEDITNNYSAYCTFAVEHAAQPGGVYVWRSAEKTATLPEAFSCYAVRILGANTFGSFYETGSAPEDTNWSHGYAKFTEQNDLTGDTGHVSIPDGAPGYGTVIYSEYQSSGDHIYLNTALDRYRPVSTVYVDKSLQKLDSYNARLSVISLGTADENNTTYHIAGIKALTGEVAFSENTSSEAAAYAQLGLPKFSPTPDFPDGKQISTMTNYETDFFGALYTHNDKKVTLDNGNTMYPYTLIASVGTRHTGKGSFPGVNKERICNNDVAIDYRIVTYDKSVLRKLLEDIDAKGEITLGSQFYSDKVAFDAFIAALQNAQFVLNDPDTDQNTIDAAAEALRTALAGLEGKVAGADYTAVNAAIARAGELEPGQYTKASWNNLVNAIGAVKTGYSRYSQTAVDKMALDIEAAIDGLKKQPAHTHAFSDAWTTDETAHWHECTAEDCVIEAYSTCGIAGAAYGEHTPDKDGICTVCQKSLVYKIAKEAATCKKTGHLAYYRNGAKYYKNQSYTQEIINITEWLNTDVSNGGGRIPVTGHKWESTSATQHRCVYCNTTEDHSFTGDECTGCGKIARYGYYIDRHWDEQTKRVISEEVKIPEDAVELNHKEADNASQKSITLSGGWYYVAVPERGAYAYPCIYVNGTPENPTNLIIADDCILSSAEHVGTVVVGEKNALNIYGQAGNSGVLYTNFVGNSNVFGNITIYGGNIYADNNGGNAAIGGGENGYGGNITIYGGGVFAVNNGDGAAIGNGKNGYGCNVTVYGGNVEAVSHGKGAAIGGGYCDSSGERYIYNNSNIAIYGGDVTAQSTGGGAGIGGGKNDSEEILENNITVSISGGNVKASGSEGAAGIGAGSPGAGNAANVKLIIENSEDMTVKAGNTAAETIVSAAAYIADRNRYVQINQKCEHHFVNCVCESCGLADLEQAKLDAYARLDIIADETQGVDIGRKAEEQKEKINNSTNLAEVWYNCDYLIYKYTYNFPSFPIIKQEAKAATCTEPGWAEHYKRGILLYENVYFVGPTANLIGSIPVLKAWRGYIPATGHTWESIDEAQHKCTVCGKTESHIDEDNDGMCDVCEHTLCEHEHTTDSYDWNGDHTVCTATRHCNDCNTDILTESTTKIELIEDTPGVDCQTMGTGHYEAIFMSFKKFQTPDNSTDTDYGEHIYEDYVCKYGDVEDLEGAKNDAKRAIQNAVDNSEDTIVLLLAETAETTIDNAKTVETVLKIKSDTILKINAIKAINTAAGNNPSKSVQRIVDGAKEDISSAETVEDVESIRDECLADIEKLTGTTHEHTYSENWSCDPYYHWHNATCVHTNIFSDLAEHTFYEGKTEGNLTVYTCTECGYKKYVYNPAEDSEGEVIGGTTYTGISLTLGSDISINFYMNLTEDARNNGTMTFNIGGRIVTVDGKDAKYNETEKKYYFQTPLTALEMNETVIATFNYNGVEYVQEYSVADYIEEIVGNENIYGKEAAALAKKIANYGHYAQTYLASIHSNVTIGKDGYEEMDKFDDVDIDVEKAIEALANYSVTVSGTSDNISLYGSTVYFDSATALNYYVTVKDGEPPTATAVNTVTGEEKQVEIKLYKGNIYIVSVKDITATELADDIKVTINSQITLTGSVFAYCNAVMTKNGQTDAAKNAMAAFYEYYEAAMEYISFELHFDMPEHYKVFTADGEEITGDTTVKCYRTFSFRLVPDENYKISRVISDWDIEPDENGLYTVSYVGGKHDVAVYTKIDSYCLTVKVEGEDAGEMPDTRISFVCNGDETIYAQCFAPGIYEIEIPKGKSGTIVVEKSGYKEYSQEFTADGKVEEITVDLIPND